MNPTEGDILHYGMPRRSGRYPWGSGDDPYQRNTDFLARVEALKRTGWKETAENIKKEFGLTTGEYRNEKSICKDQRRMLDVSRAKSLRADGKGPSEIGKIMGINESTVRSLLDADAEARMMATKNTVDHLRKQVDAKGMVDVGLGVDKEMGISKDRLELALYYLEKKEGYPVYEGGVPQIGMPGQRTIQRVLCVPGTEHKAIFDYSKVQSITDYASHDGGETFHKFEYPASMDSKRLKIRYADEVGPDGAKGVDKDGVIEIRRGVADLSLGPDRYAQVRILVDGDRYMKGMAVYSDNMPDGVDVVFNTNKGSDVPMRDVLKKIKSDPDNPFGTTISPNGQSYYDAPDGSKQLRLINKCRREGDWSDWSDSLPSQFLGKQSLDLARKQLGIAKADKQAEFDEICALNNPTIKKHLLKKFADECDSAAVHLKAAALPGQKHHVIIPINTLKDDEVYAPRYPDGSKVALIRYPHGGTFEIPILTVNNKNPLAQRVIGKSGVDAVGISKNNADILSGADFDGDTVMVIPTHDKGGKVKITSTRPLDGLKGFDPKLEYPERPGMKYMKNPVTGKDATQLEMGKISNLITDMTLGGATPSELARAVRHSMVVIDAGKHRLDYKRSEIDNGIDQLKRNYQHKIDPVTGKEKYGGASTILSSAKGQATVDRRQGSPKVNIKGDKDYDPSRPEGALLWKLADDLTYEVPSVNKRTGEVTYKTKNRTQKSTNMAETDDAYTLVSTSRHPMELLYADYANSMKALANRARVEMMSTGKIPYDPKAKEKYKTEVKELEDKLDDAMLNKPREREAQRRANVEVKNKLLANPDMSKADQKKLEQQALARARADVAQIPRSVRNIDITDRQWEAIQAGAISESKLVRILNNTDIGKLRERATPRATKTVPTSTVNRIKAMSGSYTINQIAEALNMSPSTVAKYLKGSE